MNKKYLHVLFLLLPILLFGFFFYSAQRGILLFQDSLRKDAETHANETRNAAIGAFARVRSRLTRIAGSGDIRHALVQFSYGESLEKGQLFLKQESTRLQHCSRLRLVNLKGTIVIDTVEPTLEGKPLIAAELTLFGSPEQEKTGYAFLKDGTLVVRVPAREVGGMVTGSLYASFHRDFFSTLYTPIGERARNYAYLFSEEVLFFNIPRSIGDRKKISSIGRHLRRTLDPYYEDRVVIYPARESGFPYVFAYGIDRDQVGLPVLARWILLINGFIILASFLLYFLHHRALRQNSKMDKFRKEIDSIGETISATAATADQIILETESLYHQSEKVARDISVAVEARPALAAASPEPSGDDSVATQVSAPPTVDEILARKEGAPDGGFVAKVRDTELQDLIDRVADEDREGTTMTAEKTDKASNNSIFGAAGMEEYWDNINPLLKKSLGLSVFMLLEPDGEGVFSVSHSVGLNPEITASLTVHQEEPFFGLFPKIHKVLFVKDSVLKNQTLREKFPALDEDFFRQLALVPVLVGDDVCGLLILGAVAGDPEIDIFTLHEVMYLSML